MKTRTDYLLREELAALVHSIPKSNPLPGKHVSLTYLAAKQVLMTYAASPTRDNLIAAALALGIPSFRLGLYPIDLERHDWSEAMLKSFNIR